MIIAPPWLGQENNFAIWMIIQRGLVRSSIFQGIDWDYFVKYNFLQNYLWGEETTSYPLTWNVQSKHYGWNSILNSTQYQDWEQIHCSLHTCLRILSSVRGSTNFTFSLKHNFYQSKLGDKWQEYNGKRVFTSQIITQEKNPSNCILRVMSHFFTGHDPQVEWHFLIG